MVYTANMATLPKMKINVKLGKPDKLYKFCFEIYYKMLVTCQSQITMHTDGQLNAQTEA